jgi:uncharacterized Zn finger protein (UPF0148 family)
VGVNGSGDVVCSVEETNRIRAALGLKPLQIDDPEEAKERERKAQEQEKEREENSKLRKTLQIADVITKFEANFELFSLLERMKEEREYKSKIIGKSLGEELEEEDVGASAWVSKSRFGQATCALIHILG